MNRAALAVAGLALVGAGLTGMARAPAAVDFVVARSGPITVRATALSPGAGGMLTAGVQVTSSEHGADQLDAAIATGGAAVAIYHEWISLDSLSDLTDCGGIVPPSAVVQQWEHYGTLTVPGRSSVPAQAADATLTVQPADGVDAGQTLAITLYFANAGPVVLRLPVSGTAG